jgi:hypothetical protein
VEGVEDQAGVAGADLVGGETADHFVDDVLEVRLGGREREGKGLTGRLRWGAIIVLEEISSHFCVQ